jgi:ABC-type amino acid transport substrate-binding protein
MGKAVPWVRDVLLLLALQIGLTVAASATAWFTIREPRYTLVFATIPAGAMLFAFLRRGRALMRGFSYRLLLALAGAIGWGTASGLFVVWLKVISGAGARLSALALITGFAVLWMWYVVGTMIGLWAGSARRRDESTT